MPPETFAALPDLMRAIHETLMALRRDMEASKELQRKTHNVLNDIHAELRYLREQRTRFERIERQVAELVELDRDNARIEKLLDDADKAQKKAAAVIDEVP